ncbi:MAG: hypothetical protein PHQ85_10110 [Eubacteriales bacterium]|jgi:hypothetical protein|nr:hypothetical protein [Eubacteriales bacterium]MDD4106217.1 hypothetical protein [Eubacteriales bacterium]MDD4711580.1 hypothetical protein [Eubacteriales bacterium]NLO15457.1 hypothetical protein [Clostridiales bacterium]
MKIKTFTARQVHATSPVLLIPKWLMRTRQWHINKAGAPGNGKTFIAEANLEVAHP